MSKKKDDLSDLIGGEQPAADAQETKVDETALDPGASDNAGATETGATDLDKIEADRIAAEIAANKAKLEEEQPAPVLEPANDADKSVLEAHLRRQENWEEEFKDYFPEKAIADQKREKLLLDIDALQRKENKEKLKLARQGARNAAAARVTELKAANEQLYLQIEANEAEIKQQTELANAPEPPDEDDEEDVKKSSKKKG